MDRLSSSASTVPSINDYLEHWIQTSEALKNVFIEEWISTSGDAPGEQETINAPLSMTTMARDDETPAGRLTLLKTASRRFTDADFSGIRKK